MHYSKFIIQNYKGIKNITIDLEKEPKSKILTLVGLNESGKTSILEAIDLFENDTNEADSHKLIPKNHKSNFNDNVTVKAILKLNAKDEKLIKLYAKTINFLITDTIGEIEIERIKCFKNSVYDKAESSSTWALTIKGSVVGTSRKGTLNHKSEEWAKITDYIQNNLIPPIIYYPDFLFDFPSKIYLEKYPDETEEQETYREVISDILDSLGGNYNIKSHLIERMKVESEDVREALDSTINLMSEKVSKTVFQAWETLFESKGKEIILKPNVEKGDPTKYYLEVRLKEGAQQFQIAERSLGFKWFFTFLLFTEFRKMRSSDNGEILFLLDEPASNLHSTAQKNLLKTFEKLADKCKLIYTTHSHHLINPDWLSGAYIIRNKNLDYNDEMSFDSRKTEVEAMQYNQFAAKYPEQQTYFQPILDSIEYQPGLLEKVPDIVITEGKYDYYTLRYLHEIIIGGDKIINFYPGMGADKNRDVIALYLAWNRKFKVLLDGDDHGIRAKERYLEEFGVLLKDKIFTLKDIDSTFNFPTELLFTDEERLIITKKFDKTAIKFDKTKFNKAVQMLFISKEKVELSAETFDRFSKIISKL
ncbi:MAG: family ATPase [Bacteroidetes bacterium]|jgi:predicted ATPase|nr:family ATPase [Bacteroidota bacterium]